jgi:hypothetical protein
MIHDNLRLFKLQCFLSSYNHNQGNLFKKITENSFVNIYTQFIFIFIIYVSVNFGSSFSMKLNSLNWKAAAITAQAAVRQFYIYLYILENII